MTCTIKIKMDNAAFVENPSELSRILTGLAGNAITNNGREKGEKTILDYNGNGVGVLTIKGR